VRQPAEPAVVDDASYLNVGTSERLNVLTWSPEAETELQKIPFFVRKKARRNTELYATEQGIATISLDTLYEAKAHFGR
jgi:light-independent protochlorophyllide reductase subunit B